MIVIHRAGVINQVPSSEEGTCWAPATDLVLGAGDKGTLPTVALLRRGKTRRWNSWVGPCLGVKRGDQSHHMKDRIKPPSNSSAVKIDSNRHLPSLFI